MEIYKIGKITKVSKKYIIIESNNTGYLIYIARFEDWKEKLIKKVFLYTQKTEYSKTLYGFVNLEEYFLFLDLIKIKNIGPKISLKLLIIPPKELITLIINKEKEKIFELTNVNKNRIEKIISDFESKYSNYQKNFSDQKQEQLIFKAKNILKTLGFNQKQIITGLKNLNYFNNIDQIIQESIEVIANKND